MELSRKVGGADQRPLVRALFGLSLTYSARGKIRIGRKVAEQMLVVAERLQEPTRFDLVVNLKAVKALGLTIPQSILPRRGHRLTWRAAFLVAIALGAVVAGRPCPPRRRRRASSAAASCRSPDRPRPKYSTPFVKDCATSATSRDEPKPVMHGDEKSIFRVHRATISRIAAKARAMSGEARSVLSVLPHPAG
jgi:hypothetical protein